MDWFLYDRDLLHEEVKEMKNPKAEIHSNQNNKQTDKPIDFLVAANQDFVLEHLWIHKQIFYFNVFFHGVKNNQNLCPQPDQPVILMGFVQ